MPAQITFNVEDLKTADRLERVLRQVQDAIQKNAEAQQKTDTQVQAVMATSTQQSSPASGFGTGGAGVASGTTPTTTPNISQGTHAVRLASFPTPAAADYFYYETDRTVLYISLVSLVWEYVAGIYIAAFASRPSDLGTADAGFIFIDSTTNTEYRWDGAAWIKFVSAPGVVGICIDGNGSVPATGSKGFLAMTFAGTITEWTLIADQVGAAQIDIKKGTPSGNTNMPTCTSIVASDAPSLSTQQRKRDTALTGWTTALAVNDVLEFNLDSITTCTRVVLEVVVART